MFTGKPTPEWWGQDQDHHYTQPADPETEIPVADLLREFDEMIEIACRDGTWNVDPYLFGMANGMIFMRSIVSGEEPQYLEAPAEWSGESSGVEAESDKRSLARGETTRYVTRDYLRQYVESTGVDLDDIKRHYGLGQHSASAQYRRGFVDGQDFGHAILDDAAQLEHGTTALQRDVDRLGWDGAVEHQQDLGDAAQQRLDPNAISKTMWQMGVRDAKLLGPGLITVEEAKARAARSVASTKQEILATLTSKFNFGEPNEFDTQISTEAAYAQEQDAMVAWTAVRQYIDSVLRQLLPVTTTETDFGMAQTILGLIEVASHVGRVRCRCSDPWRLHVGITTLAK
ncbi:MAG: hypothetical protein WC505_06845 [Patescibacteria group bacterium]